MPDTPSHQIERQTTVSERVREILGDDTLTEDMHLVYEWSGGYEKLYRKRDGCGALEYAGSFHPDGSCVGTGVCRYCGRTLAFD